MKTAVAYTMEIDDIAIATEELVTAIRGQLDGAPASCGVLYYDYEMEIEDLAGQLEKVLNIPVVGCSCIGALDGKTGYHEMMAMLTVYSAGDCSVGIALSERINGENCEEAVAKAYNRAKSAMDHDPALLYMLAPCSPSLQVERCVRTLTELSGGAPIIGGIPSSPGTSRKTVLYGRKTSEDRLVLLAIGGAIRPVCAMANVVTRISDKQGTITKSKGNILYKVNGKPFEEFLNSFGSNLETTLGVTREVFFQKYPLLVENTGTAADGVPVVRILLDINSLDGSGISFADFPEDGVVSLVMLRREEIGETVEAGIRELMGKIAENSRDGYTYSTVVCVSCAARHITMNPYHTMEGDVIAEKLPDSLTLSGFYSLGEFCPTSVTEQGAHNCVHNASIAFCAF